MVPRQFWQRQDVLINFSWTLLTVLIVMLVVHDNPGPDYWYHLFLGQQIFLTGYVEPSDTLIRVMPNYLNVYWFYQLIQHLLFRSLGQFGPCLLYLSLAMITACFWFKTVCKVAWGTWQSALLALAAILIWNTRFEWRPEMVTYACLSVLMYILTKSTPAKTLSVGVIFGVAVNQWVWTNSHGYFVLGPLLIIAALGVALVKAQWTEGRSLLVLLGVSVLASLAGPLHVRSWLHVFHMHGFLNSMASQIQEFMAPTHPVYLRVWTIMLFWGFWAATALTALWLAKRREYWLQVGLAVLGLYLSGRYYRNIPLLPLLAGPLWSVAWLFKAKVAPRRATWAVQFLLVCLTASVASGHYYDSRFSSTRLGLKIRDEHVPRSFAKFINASNFSGKVLNSSSDGGYLELVTPQLRIYGDSRFSDRDATITHFEALSSETFFNELDKKHNFDGVLLRIIENQVLIHQLLKSGDWTLAYTDLHRAFFVSERTIQGSRFLPRQYSFYGGEVIELGDNLIKAVQWTKFLAALQRFTLLEDAIGHYLNLPSIHPSVMAIAIRYYEGKGDTAKLWRLRELQDRVKHIPGDDLVFVKEKLVAL